MKEDWGRRGKGGVSGTGIQIREMRHGERKSGDGLGDGGTEDRGRVGGGPAAPATRPAMDVRAGVHSSGPGGARVGGWVVVPHDRGRRADSRSAVAAGGSSSVSVPRSRGCV